MHTRTAGDACHSVERQCINDATASGISYADMHRAAKDVTRMGRQSAEGDAGMRTIRITDSNSAATICHSFGGGEEPDPVERLTPGTPGPTPGSSTIVPQLARRLPRLSLPSAGGGRTSAGGWMRLNDEEKRHPSVVHSSI